MQYNMQPNIHICTTKIIKKWGLTKLSQKYMVQFLVPQPTVPGDEHQDR